MWGIDAREEYNEGFIDCFKQICEEIKINKEDFDKFILANKNIFNQCKIYERDNCSKIIKDNDTFERSVFVALGTKI